MRCAYKIKYYARKYKILVFFSSFWSSASNSNLNTNSEDAYFEKDSLETDISRRGSDLYSPELNLEAHRTAQEVKSTNLFNYILHKDIITDCKI